MSAKISQLRVFLIDDEALALKRLARLLQATGRVEIAGSATDPEAALDFLSRENVDALFLDIEMPGLNGFEMLARLKSQPLVIFTTAYDQYALRAFEVNSIDYLLKPIEAEQLDRALAKLERMRASGAPVELRNALEQLALAYGARNSEYPERIASRIGDRVQFIELRSVTHFIAKDKLTFGVTDEKSYVVDSPISELEQKLDPKKFIRIHRSTLVNLDWVHEVHSAFAGGMVVRLKSAKRTELPVSRDRVRALKERLGF
ncbi:MAG TPA: LytTR family DNA-binding domain-containing protein [Blastocatellia bacterium]|nr:LytTR family DNA-binding domain-containing protein [Blastocatellia bacterium]